MNAPRQNTNAMELFFQHPIEPAEGALVTVLMLVILGLLVVVYLMAQRNIYLSEENSQITRDAIKGFKDVIAALNSIREQLQEGDNALMGKINDHEKEAKDTNSRLYEKISNVRAEIIGHLQYLRDKAK